MTTPNTIQWQPSPIVQALRDAVQFPRTSPSWFDILYPRKEERPIAQSQPPPTAKIEITPQPKDAQSHIQ
jgi:hypothetical protein